MLFLIFVRVTMVEIDSTAGASKVWRRWCNAVILLVLERRVGAEVKLAQLRDCWLNRAAGGIQVVPSAAQSALVRWLSYRAPVPLS